MSNGEGKKGIEKQVLFLIVILSSIVFGIFGAWYISVPAAFICGILIEYLPLPFLKKKKIVGSIKYENEVIFDESKVKNDFFVDEPVFEERVIDPASLSFEQRKILSKVIAEKMYYQFLSVTDLKDFEIIVSELRDSCGNRLIGKVKVKSPKTTLLTIPENVRRKKMPLKPVSNLVERKRTEKFTVTVPEEITIENIPDDKMEEISSSIIDTDDIDDDEETILPAIEDEEKPATVKPAIPFLDKKPEKPLKKLPIKTLKPAMLATKPVIKIVPKPVKDDEPEDEDISITPEDLKALWDSDTNEDEFEPPIDPALKASLKEVDDNDDDFI